jgi:hypothetical protein
MPLLLALLALQAAAERLPASIFNPSFERDLQGWLSDSNERGYRAGAAEEVDYNSGRAADGRSWLHIGWASRRGTPPGAYYRLTTRIDAQRYRGRTVAFSAAVRLPEHAHRAAALTARVVGPAGASESEQRLNAGPAWRRERLVFRVARDAGSIELGFLVDGRGGELEADAVRLQIQR